MGMCTPASIKNQQCESEGNNHSYQRSKKYESRNLQNDIELNSIETMSHNGSSCKSANKGMGRR